ncbi:MAG: hypothetical protein GX159_10015 [Flavobacteriaceae bacterium]|jgi:hypothetical protein|nr:hypothetical protein [Flavobacteriaceae bacterium]
MKRYYSLFLFIFLGFQFASATSPEAIETKVIDKSFTVNPNAELRINNKYGNINMTTWDRNTIEFHIEIKVDGANADRVKDRINSISVEFKANPNLVSAETIIKNIRNSNNINITINYFVKLPKTNNINITNRYGNISLDQLKGSSVIQLDYGNMSLGKMENALNTWDLDYVTSANVDFVKSVHMDLDYSKVNIKKSELINLTADYSDASLGEIGDLLSQMEYGNLFVEQVNSLSGVVAYTNVKTNTLNTSFVMNMRYGSLSIGNVRKGFNKISIGADYSDVSVGIGSNVGYKLNGNFKYGGLKFPSHLSMSKQIEKSTAKTYEGTAGDGSGEILINMNYGSAKIK